VFLVNLPNSRETVITAVEPSPERSDPQIVAIEAVSSILGARLGTVLRDNNHWASAAGTYVLDTKGRQPFAAFAFVQKDKTAHAMRAMSNELNGIRGTRPPSDAELRLARDRLIRPLSGANQTSAEIARAYAEILTHGLPDDDWNGLPSRADALTLAQTQAAANSLVHPESLTWVVVGDLSVIETEVRELGLGKVQVIDVDGNLVR